MEFFNGQSFTRLYGAFRYELFIPVYMKKGDESKFITNRLPNVYGRDKEVDEILQQLSENNGDFYTLYNSLGGRADTPIEFAKYIKEKGLNYQDAHIGRYETKDCGYVDFGGNLMEFSCAFCFRIYDSKMIAEVSRISEIDVIYYEHKNTGEAENLSE